VPPIVTMAPWRVRSAKPTASRVIAVTFNDGLGGLVDMDELVSSPNAGVFAALRDLEAFNKVRVTYGVVTWPGEIDLAPEPMYAAIKRTGVYVPRAEPHEPDQSPERA
jgi:hypothetical protein